MWPGRRQNGRGGFLLCPKCGLPTAVVHSAPYRDHRVRRRKCEGCGNRFTTTETVLGVAAHSSNQIRQPASAVGFVCSCLDRADNPGQVVQLINALISGASKLALGANPALDHPEAVLPEMEQCESATSVSA
jgi:hypothetical protein